MLADHDFIRMLEDMPFHGFAVDDDTIHAA